MLELASLIFGVGSGFGGMPDGRGGVFSVSVVSKIELTTDGFFKLSTLSLDFPNASRTERTFNVFLSESHIFFMIFRFYIFNSKMAPTTLQFKRSIHSLWST